MRRLLDWLRSTGAFLVARPAALALVVVAGTSGAGTGVPAGARLFDYMWRDPVFCGDCHIHDYANENWAASAHANLTTCHDCHLVPIRHYPRNLWKAALARPQTPEEVPSAHVGSVMCEQCHAAAGDGHPLTGPMPDELRASVPKVDESPLHRVHLDAKDRVPDRYHGGRPEAEAAEPAREPAAAEGHHGGTPSAIGCLDCHGGKDLEVHTFAASSADCVTCHEGITPTDERGAELSCLDCHGRGFVGAEPEELSLRGGTTR